MAPGARARRPVRIVAFAPARSSVAASPALSPIPPSLPHSRTHSLTHSPPLSALPFALSPSLSHPHSHSLLQAPSPPSHAHKHTRLSRQGSVRTRFGISPNKRFAFWKGAPSCACARRPNWKARCALTIAHQAEQTIDNFSRIFLSWNRGEPVARQDERYNEKMCCLCWRLGIFSCFVHAGDLASWICIFPLHILPDLKTLL